MKWLMDIIGMVREFLRWRAAKEENRAKPPVVRARDAAARAVAREIARAEVAGKDAAASARTVDRVIEGETGAHLPAAAAAQQAARDEIARKDAAAMTARLKGVLAAAVLCALAAGLAGCAALRSVPPPTPTWSLSYETRNGEEVVVLPVAVYAKMLDRLVYLKTIEEQGRIRDE